MACPRKKRPDAAFFYPSKGYPHFLRPGKRGKRDKKKTGGPSAQGFSLGDSRVPRNDGGDSGVGLQVTDFPTLKRSLESKTKVVGGKRDEEQKISNLPSHYLRAISSLCTTIILTRMRTKKMVTERKEPPRKTSYPVGEDQWQSGLLEQETWQAKAGEGE